MIIWPSKSVQWYTNSNTHRTSVFVVALFPIPSVPHLSVYEQPKPVTVCSSKSVKWYTNIHRTSVFVVALSYGHRITENTQRPHDLTACLGCLRRCPCWLDVGSVSTVECTCLYIIPDLTGVALSPCCRSKSLSHVWTAPAILNLCQFWKWICIAELLLFSTFYFCFDRVLPLWSWG